MNKKVIKLCSRKPLECLWSVVFIKNKYMLTRTTPTHVASYLWRDLELGLLECFHGDCGLEWQQSNVTGAMQRGGRRDQPIDSHSHGKTGWDPQTRRTINRIIILSVIFRSVSFLLIFTTIMKRVSISFRKILNISFLISICEVMKLVAGVYPCDQLRQFSIFRRIC